MILAVSDTEDFALKKSGAGALSTEGPGFVDSWGPVAGRADLGRRLSSDPCMSRFDVRSRGESTWGGLALESGSRHERLLRRESDHSGGLPRDESQVG